MASSAVAQDKCSDVLANGTFQDVKYRENEYFQQINYARFIRSTFESSKTDKSFGADVAVGKLVMGGDYDESAYNAKKAYLQTTTLTQITANREIDLALMSGDETIVNAWTACMKSRGGPSVLFSKQSAREMFVRLEFFSAPNTKTKLTSDLKLPIGATVNSGKECFKKGRVLKAGVPCTAAITLPYATTTVIWSVNTPSGSSQAYLPARLVLQHERRPYRFAPDCDNLGKSPSLPEVARCDDRLWSYWHQRSGTRAKTITLTEQQMREGWLFDPASARSAVKYIERYSPSGMSWCYNDSREATMTRFTYRYEAIARTSGHDRVSQLWCMVDPAIDVVRDIWAPAS
jgi:hypothetical protein